MVPGRAALMRIGQGESVPIATSALFREVGPRAYGIQTVLDSVCQATKTRSA